MSEIDWQAVSQLTEASKVFADSVRAIARIEAMKAGNKMRAIKGESPAYGEADFDDVPESHGIGYNSLVSRFRY